VRFSKEIKAGLIAIFAIAFLVAGVNFLKGNSFFGGDRIYYAYFPNSGQIAPSNNVTLNGVIVGKVMTIEYVATNPPDKKVKVGFSIAEKNIQIPKGSRIEIGSLDLLNKGMLLFLNPDLSKGFVNPGETIEGKLSVDMFSQVKQYADPISQKVQAMMSSVDKMVGSLSAFWDNTATSEIEGSMRDVKLAIRKLGNVADQMEGFVADEKIKFDKILNNVENITFNLKKSNDEITAIIGNTKKITDDVVSSEYIEVISEAKKSLKSFNDVLLKVKNGEGSIGLLLNDKQLYNELVTSNKDLQNLVKDLQKNPNRYVHLSVFGSKVKGTQLSPREEKKLKKLLDSIPE
jgi:phospholipid/cholesterol/gamma-HCH transport system substrate-binding protein